MAPCVSFYCCIRISHECKSLTKSISSLIFSVGEEARCAQTRSTLGSQKSSVKCWLGRRYRGPPGEEPTWVRRAGTRTWVSWQLLLRGRGQRPEAASSSSPVGSPTHAPPGVRRSDDQLYHSITSSYPLRHAHLSPFHYSGVGSMLQDSPPAPTYIHSEEAITWNSETGDTVPV